MDIKFDLKSMKLPSEGVVDAKGGYSKKKNAIIKFGFQTPSGLVLVTFMPGFQSKSTQTKVQDADAGPATVQTQDEKLGETLAAFIVKK